MKVKSIWAMGTSGAVEGLTFYAKPNRSGKYVLNKKAVAGAKHATNKLQQKVYVDSLCEAWELLQHDKHLINLTGPSGERALRQKSAVQASF